GRNRKIAILAKRVYRAARAVGVALVFADIHDQPRIERAPIEAVRQAKLDPIGMFARDGVSSAENLRLHRSGDMDEIDSAARRGERGWRLLEERLLTGPRAKHSFDFLLHACRFEVADNKKNCILRRVEIPIERAQLLDAIGGDLLFCR